MVERSSEVRNAAVLMVLEGAFHIYLGYSSYQLSVVLPNPVLVIVGNVMIVIGLLVLVVSLAVWLQRSWAIQAIVGIAVVSCAALIIFGYYTMTVFIALISYASLDYLRKGKLYETRVVANPDSENEDLMS